MTVKVRSGWVGGQEWFFYAEANDFSPVWSGPYFTFPTVGGVRLVLGHVCGQRQDARHAEGVRGSLVLDYTIGLVA